jgi:hypothetical protein
MGVLAMTPAELMDFRDIVESEIGAVLERARKEDV